MGQPDIRGLQPEDQNPLQEQLWTGEKQTDEDHKTILVAEDNPVNQKIIALLLEKLGLKAHIVNNGLQAVEAVRMRDYPVVLMDCHMPELDGFEATKNIRKLEVASGRHTPIIAVTALAMAGDRERCIAAGMDDYISKPVNRERLKNKLNLWMKGEFCFANQKLAAKFFQATATLARERDPIDLAELEGFYGSIEEVQDVLTLFVLTTRTALTRMKTAIAAAAEDKVPKLAHELKGASASVGAKEMSILCLQLESEAGQQVWDQTQRTYQSLAQCFQSVEDFVQRTFKPVTASPSHSQS